MSQEDAKTIEHAFIRYLNPSLNDEGCGEFTEEDRKVLLPILPILEEEEHDAA